MLMFRERDMLRCHSVEYLLRVHEMFIEKPIKPVLGDIKTWEFYWVVPRKDL